MAHYIDKDALVAEIERIKKENYYDTHDEYDGFVRNALDKFLSFIDTLEVKEVDDEPECKIFPRPIECYSNCKECPWLATNNKAQKGE